jgi:uncharacterized membrane protein YbhN (UPF0104 family)
MKRFSILIKAALSVTFMILVVGQVELAESVRLFSHFKILYFLAAFSLIFPTVFANAWKWKILLEVLGHRVPLGKLINMYMTGFFFNSFLTGIGDIKRIVDLSAECRDPAAAAISVFMERWTGTVVTLTFAIATLSFSVFIYPEIRIFMAFCFLLLFLLVGLYIAVERIAHYPVLSRIAAIHFWIDKLRGTLQSYRGASGTVVQALLLSFITPVLLIITHWFVVRSLGIEISLGVLTMFIPTIWVFAQVPISVNGFGIQDMAFVKLLAVSGLSGSWALSISLVTHLLRISVGALGGIFYITGAASRLPVEEIAKGAGDRH